MLRCPRCLRCLIFVGDCCLYVSMLLVYVALICDMRYALICVVGFELCYVAYVFDVLVAC